MGMGAKLKAIIDQRNIKVSDIADYVGVKPTTLYSFFNRDSDGIKLSVFFSICDYLNIAPDSLKDNMVVKNSSPYASNDDAILLRKYHALDIHGKRIVDFSLDEEYTRCIAPIKPEKKQPMFSIRHSLYKVSAGIGFMLDGSNAWETMPIPDTPEARRADFALTITGDSMEPIYYDGDIVLVEECNELREGEVGIYIVNGDGYIKKYGGDRLISLNNKYKDIKFKEFDTIKCVGRVIGRV